MLNCFISEEGRGRGWGDGELGKGECVLEGGEVGAEEVGC